MTAPGDAPPNLPARRDRREPSLRHAVALAALTGALAHAAPAQECDFPARDSAVSGPLAVIPAPRIEAMNAVLRALRGAGHSIADVTDTTVVTVPSAGWPTMTIPIARHFQEHEHPGVVIQVALWPEGDSTFVETTVRALCGAPPDDSSHGHVSIERIAVAAAQLAVEGALLEQVIALAGAAAPETPLERRPRLQSCLPLSQADNTVPVTGPDSVVLSFVIDSTGVVEPGTVVPASSEGGPAAIERARRMIERCRFTPAMIRGRPVRARVSQPVRFREGPPDETP